MPTKPGLPMPNAGGARLRSRGLGHRGWGGFGGRKKKSRLIICDQTGDLGRLPFGTFSEVTPFYTWGTAKECTDFWGCESKVTNTTGLHGCLKPDLGVGLFIRWGWDKGRTRAWIWRPPGFSSMVQQLLFVQGRDYHDCILQSRNSRPCQLRSASDSRPGSFPQEFRLLITTQSLTLNKPRTLHAGPPGLHPPQGGAG